MKELKLFLKYGLFFQISQGRKKKRAGKYKFLIIQLLITAYFAGFTTFTLLTTFGTLKGMEFQGVNFLDVSAYYWMFMASVFFLAGAIGSAIYMLSLNEEIEFLLALPLRRWTIVFYQIFMSVFHDLPAFGMFMGVLIAYGVTYGGWVYGLYGALTGLFHAFFLLMLSVFFAVFVSRKIKGSLARRIFILIQSVVLVGFVLILNSALTTTEEPQKILENLLKYQDIMMSPFNIFGYSVSAIKNPVYLLLSLLLGIVFIYAFIYASKDFSFGVVKKTTSKKARIKRSGYVLAIVRKIFKAFFRQDNSLFLLLYPYVFGLFMGWGVKEPVYAVLVALPISGMYVLLQTSQIFMHDLVNWELTKSIPISFKRSATLTVATPVFMNFLLILGIGTFTSVYKGESLDLRFLFLIIGSVFMHTVSSVGGLYVVLSNPPKSENIPREMMRGPMWLSFLLMAVSGGLVLGIGTFEKWWGKLVLSSSVFIAILLLRFFVKNALRNYNKLLKGLL